MITELENAIIKNKADFHPVVNFDVTKDKLFYFDFTRSEEHTSELQSQ